MSRAQVYTLGAWIAKPGKEQAFIDAWKELGKVFAALPDPPGTGKLLQSDADPTVFYSFGPWKDLAAIQAMRADEDAAAALERLMALCTKASPGTFHVVAESVSGRQDR